MKKTKQKKHPAKPVVSEIALYPDEILVKLENRGGEFEYLRVLGEPDDSNSSGELATDDIVAFYTLTGFRRVIRTTTLENM